MLVVAMQAAPEVKLSWSHYCRYLAWIVAFLLVSTTAARAQNAATCQGKADLSQLIVTQTQGRATIEAEKPGNAGRKIEVEYGDDIFSRKFGADGRVRFGFALTAPKNRFVITIGETAPINCTLDVPGFNNFYRAILRWRDPIQLDLHIVEPGGLLGGAGHVSASNPNTDLKQGVGLVDIFGEVPVDGATAEMSYVADAAAIPPDGVFSFKVDYLTRGAMPEAPYCDDKPLAAPQFEFISIANGNVRTQRMSTNRARCREKIADNRRLIPIRQ